MRQTDYSIGRVRRRFKKKRRNILAAMVLCLDKNVLLRTYGDYKRTKNNKRCYVSRKRHVRSVHFNLNMYSEEQSVNEFCFRTFEVGRIAQLIGFTGAQTERSGYYCNDIKVACVVMCRLTALAVGMA